MNDIESGVLELTSFTGAKLELLQQELAYRSSALSCNVQGLPLSSVSLVKYSYYRKQKVIEYAKFIDNMNTPADSFAKHAIYPYDTTYFVLSNDAD